MYGATDLLRYWGLSSRPFDDTVDRRFFYSSVEHTEALARLALLVEDGAMGMGLLIGSPGSGKTFVAAVLAQGLDRRRFAPIYLARPVGGTSYILREMLGMLGGWTSATATNYELQCELRKLMANRFASCGLEPVLIIDEAQELGPADLTELRCLPTTVGLRMTIILIGQSELGRLVAGLPSFASRVGIGFRLRGVSAAEGAAYLAHRLRAAGHPTGRIFTEDAAVAITEYASGSPRQMNQLAKLCLYSAAARLARSVSAADVHAIANDRAKLLAEPSTPEASAA